MIKHYVDLYVYPPPPPPHSPQLVELKNGETYNGHLVNCDNWMNIHLRDVICTSRVRNRIRAGGNPWEERRRGIMCAYISLLAISHLIAQDGDRFWRMPECFIRGSVVKYLRIPDEVCEHLKNVSWGGGETWNECIN